ncbi:HK97 family phage prohead protease [Rhizobium sp. LjRoot30]|uniref:HK97 family phage prohead protease n=1 Tax=Rhizobium sp. LjRoot30 TaxID=3342320 RepID=UPI003ECF59E0
MTQNIQNLPRFGRDAEVRSASFDEAENTIEVIWTTGAPVRRWSWRHDRYYQEILEVTPKAVRLDRLNAGAPFLDSHSDGRLAHVIGSVVRGSARIEGGIGYARIKLSRADEDKAIIDKIRDGIIRNISVGYAIHKVVKTDADGDGNDEEWRVVDWEPLEISAVPVPADAGSQIRGREHNVEMPCEFVTETDERSTAEIREAMASRHFAALPNLATRAHDAFGKGAICEDFLRSILAADEATREHSDPLVAAEAAWAACAGMAREDRIAAYAAAFAITAA